MGQRDIKSKVLHILYKYGIENKRAEEIAREISSLFEEIPKSKRIQAQIYIDGGSRGNPGRGASAFVIYLDNRKLIEGGIFFKKTTNNEAEYNSLIYALKECLKERIKDVKVYTDSELLARQIRGEYRVKSPSLAPLYEMSLNLIKQFEQFEINHIPREQNQEADRLVNLVIDLQKDIFKRYNV